MIRLRDAVAERGAPDAPLRHLISPILEQRRFSAKDAEGELIALCRLAHDLPQPCLAKAADLILASGVMTIKSERIRDAIAAVRKAGEMIVISRHDTPRQWSAWLAYERHANPRVADLMGRYTRWQVKRPWPPGHSQEADT